MAKSAKRTNKSVKLATSNGKSVNPNNQTNQVIDDYSIEKAIHEILLGTELTGRAESGFVAAIFNDEQWQATKDKKTNKWNNPVLNYWNAPEKNTDKNGKKIPGMGPKRAEHASTFLMKFEEYAAIGTKITETNTALKKAVKDGASIAEAAARNALIIYNKKINAAHSMFSRAMQSVYLLRTEMKAVKVKLGQFNEVMVTTANDKTEAYKVGNLRDRGAELLRKDGKMKAVVNRGANAKANNGNGTAATVPAVNALTSRIVVQGLDKLLEQEAFNPPLNSDAQGTVLNKNDLAEHALRIVQKFNPTDAANSAEFRGTISQMIVALFPILGVKTFKDAQALAMTAANKAA